MYNVNNENDFKYYMQDIERYYFGARYSYSEILNNENAPFKFKRVISKYLTREDDEYQVFRQLKVRVRTSKYKKGNTPEKGYTEKIYKIEELARMSKEDKENAGIIIRELIVSKLALFAFSI